MSGVIYIIFGILIFGILIAVHELGHFLAARSLGVRVNEFSIGMGPKVWKKQGKETLYTIRALPFGGFCQMEGEDEDTGDARAFTAAKRWKRGVILAAGAFMNLVLGFIIVVVIVYSQSSGFGGATITNFESYYDSTGPSGGLMVGDTVVRLNGERIYYSNDFQMFLSLAKSDTVNLVVRRDGQSVPLNHFTFNWHDVTVDGATAQKIGVDFNYISPTFGAKLNYSLYTMMNYVRLIRVSLVELFTGAAGIRDLSGPVGIVSSMYAVGEQTHQFGLALLQIINFGGFIAVNLAIMNLLPIPALDGGRILFLFIMAAIEKVAKRRVNPKYEGYIHASVFVLLVGLMAFTVINDVLRIING